MEKCNWFYESASNVKKEGVESKSSFGARATVGESSFDEKFEELAEFYRESGSGIDIKKDMAKMLDDAVFMNEYKIALFKPVIEAFEAACPGDPHISHIIENAETYWDNKINLYQESANIAAYLPMSTLEFPVLVKQFFGSIMNHIIDVESVKTPHITKHVRVTMMVDNQTGDRYEYPKCMFDGTWEKLWDASRGHKIRDEVVPLTNGRLWKYDIIDGLTDGTPGIDELSWNFKIVGIQVAGNVYPIPGNGITIEYSTGGTLVNGELNFKTSDGTLIDDMISGQLNTKAGTISLTSASGQVEGVVFEGYLSNTNNMRSISVAEERRMQKFTIEDGPRWVMPFTIEDITDAAALADMNYYNRMVDEVTKTQDMQECMSVIKFLCDQQKKFNGIETDTYNLESLANTYTVDIKPPVGFAGDPFKYCASAIQFRLKAIIYQLSEDTKLDNMAFIITGNSMATQLLGEFKEWKITQGTSVGGISVNGSYGFSTDLDANVRVVGSNLYDAYTTEPTDETKQRELILHIYVYSTSPDRITFKQLKYANHLMTSQSQTAYSSPNSPGGAYNFITATSRFKTISVQGISADLILLNSDYVYGKVPDRPSRITGAPWGEI